jgi:hypothetical protein
MKKSIKNQEVSRLKEFYGLISANSQVEFKKEIEKVTGIQERMLYRSFNDPKHPINSYPFHKLNRVYILIILQLYIPHVKLHELFPYAPELIQETI